MVGQNDTDFKMRGILENSTIVSHHPLMRMRKDQFPAHL